jgi:hypothetical protein
VATKNAVEQLRCLDHLESALEVHTAQQQVASAHSNLEQEASFRGCLETRTRERDKLELRRPR